LYKVYQKDHHRYKVHSLNSNRFYKYNIHKDKRCWDGMGVIWLMKIPF